MEVDQVKYKQPVVLPNCIRLTRKNGVSMIAFVANIESFNLDDDGQGSMVMFKSGKNRKVSEMPGDIVRALGYVPVQETVAPAQALAIATAHTGAMRRGRAKKQ